MRRRSRLLLAVVVAPNTMTTTGTNSTSTTTQSSEGNVQGIASRRHSGIQPRTIGGGGGGGGGGNRFQVMECFDALPQETIQRRGRSGLPILL